ncbi:MAG: PHP domain-containing protein [Planctomycetaceae bacterium]|nr:PHP domain-containing protein [Planctomycetaceae bacterium]
MSNSFYLSAIAVLLSLLGTDVLTAQETISIEPDLIHVRNLEPREWSEFPEDADATEFRGRFLLDKTLSGPAVICFEHQDVKQTWNVALNGENLGRLARDENSMRVCFEVFPDQLTRGLNELRVWTNSDKPDDIRIGRAQLVQQNRETYLNQRRLSVNVSAEGQPVPCRLSVLNQDKALQTTSLSSSDHYAVRAGVIYSATGHIDLGLPPGKYTVIAGRGPEYEIARREIDLTQHNSVAVELPIRRVVDTSGWVACDTHVHTLTHSGHGDSTEDERIITIAGEGIELPIVTEHNKQINYSRRQAELGLNDQYTLVTGNEVTTKWGHFNIWPVQAGGPVPGFRGNEWKKIFEDIQSAAPEIVILNHAEDIHSGYTPFGRENRHRLTGRQLADWQLQANAMEIVNSGAQQTDIMQLPRDWMVCLNRGQFLTPVGCSDSHDVARHFIGQGRTYIRCDDSDPGKLNVEQAVTSFQEGRVIVSCGLIPFLTVEEQYGPGDLVPQQKNGELKLTLRVEHPEWIEFNRYVIYVNGEPLPAISVPRTDLGRLFEQSFSIPATDHDVHLEVAVFGPGVKSLHWPIAKPYQPNSPDWESLNFGITGAIWYDGNGDGQRNSAREIAESLWKDANEKPTVAIPLLKDYDRAVALQMAELVHLSGKSIQSDEIQEVLKQQPEFVTQAFQDYWTEWRLSEIARLDRNQ